MSITRSNPNTVFLGGDRTQINDVAASEAITPGHLVIRFNNGGITRWKKCDAADVKHPAAVATDLAMLNKGVDDACAAGDLIEVSVLHKGATAWMFIASGQNISYGQKLQPAADGTLKAYATLGAEMFVALENKPNVTTLTRIRVEAI